VDVLRLAAKGLTTREIGERLFISTKTADHHTQHVYVKIGVFRKEAFAGRCSRERSRTLRRQQFSKGPSGCIRGGVYLGGTAEVYRKF
jgi:hypothetical protein